MKKLVCLILIPLLFACQLAAQGWERLYGGGGNDEIRSIAQTPDGGYILAGYYNLSSGYLIKTNADGKQQWAKFYPLGSLQNYNGVIATADTGHITVGFRRIGGIGGDPNIVVSKTNNYGTILWSKIIGNPDQEEYGNGITALSNGDFAICGYRKVDVSGNEVTYVARLNAKGEILWEKSYLLPSERNRGNAITVAPNGDFVVTGRFQEKTTVSSDVSVLRINAADGTLLWSQTYDINGKNEEGRAVAVNSANDIVVSGFLTGVNEFEGLLMKISGTGNATPVWQKSVPKTDFYGLSRIPSGGYYVAGNIPIGTTSDMYIGRSNESGDLQWGINIGRGESEEGKCVLLTADGGAVVAGNSQQFLGGGNGGTFPYLVKVDPNGVVFNSYIRCKVYRDFNSDCKKDDIEPEQKNWIINIKGANNFSRWAVTNDEGEIAVAVDTGSYLITPFPPNKYWNLCETANTVKITKFYDTAAVNIGIRSVFDCSNNVVDVATPVLRRCAENTYTINYCNNGTVPSLNTYIDVDFAPALSVQNASIPGTKVNGSVNTWRYNIGTLLNGDCGSFTVTTLLDCNTLTGQTHCAEAHIYPDSFCNKANWDQSIVRAFARCKDGKVELGLSNIGLGNMFESVGYVITEDILMRTAPGDPNFQIQLEAGKDTTLLNTFANGKTFRIISQQTTGYPGESYPTAAVEGCKQDTATTFSTGTFTMFAQDDYDDFISTDCQESTETDYEPLNLKRGYPKGYGVPKYVNPSTDFDFLIQFRNEGTNTVQQVIIRDTLPAELDPATVRPGASSHPYEFRLLGGGIVEYTLPTADLPPSGGSASEGFVRFRVGLKKDLPCPTVVRNRAAVFFDFNQPMMTDLTLHTVCDSFVVVVSTKEIQWPGAQIRVYPNPFTFSTNFEIKGVEAKEFAIQILDAQGRTLKTDYFNQTNYQLFRHQLPTGFLFYRLTADGKPVAGGKLVVKER